MRLRASRPDPLVLVAFVWGLAAGVESAETTPPAGQKSANSIVLPANLSGQFFFVSARMGELGPFRVLLDTGASILAISPEVADQLRTADKLVDLQEVRVDTASRKEPLVDLVMISDLQLGGFGVRRSRGVISDLTTLSKALGEPLDGILGLEAFEFVNLVLDYPRRQVRVETVGGRETNAVVLNCELRSHRPIVSLQVAGTNFPMYVDSGSGGGFELPAETGNLPFLARPITVSMAANFEGLEEQKAARLATNVHWGGVTFERPVVYLSSTDVGRIGGKVLQNFVVRIDQRRKEVVLIPPVQTAVPSTPVRSTGLALLPDERGLKVIAVISNTAAARAGIQRGDHVVAVNGEPARRWNQKRLRELRDTGDTFEIELLRGDKTERLQLQVATLIE